MSTYSRYVADGMRHGADSYERKVKRYNDQFVYEVAFNDKKEDLSTNVRQVNDPALNLDKSSSTSSISNTDTKSNSLEEESLKNAQLSATSRYILSKIFCTRLLQNGWASDIINKY